MNFNLNWSIGALCSYFCSFWAHVQHVIQQVLNIQSINIVHVYVRSIYLYMFGYLRFSDFRIRAFLVFKSLCSLSCFYQRLTRNTLNFRYFLTALWPCNNFDGLLDLGSMSTKPNFLRDLRMISKKLFNMLDHSLLTSVTSTT